MDKLSGSLPEVLGIALIAIILFSIVVVVFIVVLQEIGYRKILKQTQSYNQIITTNPMLQKYLEQGYQLLMMIPQKEAENAASNTGVFDYPNRSKINPSPLFCVEHLYVNPNNPKSATNVKMSNSDVFQTEIHKRGCSTVCSDYTQHLPLTANTNISFSKGIFSPEITFNVKKDGENFLQMPLPSVSLKGVSLENAYKVTCSHIPESQQWRWDNQKQESRLIETVTNRTLLTTVPVRLPFLKRVKELSYLLVHPEMPKELVPIFVELSLLAKGRRTPYSD